MTDITTSTNVEIAVLPELMASIAIGLGQSGVERLIPAGTERRWALALESEAYEAWVIAWPSGSGLEMHDHDGSIATMYVVNGRLRERYVGRNGEVSVRWLGGGDVIEMQRDHQHEVINLDATEVISVHVYSPRLRDQTFRETKAFH
jgi:quercetin dioxygenase-like cupin family protein